MLQPLTLPELSRQTGICALNTMMVPYTLSFNQMNRFSDECVGQEDRLRNLATYKILKNPD